jgi:phage repressor protein C with HTH and peptisase S24 domain
MQEEHSYLWKNRLFPTLCVMDRARRTITEAVQNGADLATLSRSIGKNHAYLQQFMKRGVPRKLPEDVRRALAKQLKVPEAALRSDDHIPSEEILLDERPTAERPDGILEIDVRAGMGGGGTVEGREVVFHGNTADPVKEEAWHFPAQFMREEVRAPQNRVIVIETQGDSMAPTLLSGDRVVVDTGHKVPSPDGIYAVRDPYGYIVVKRLQTMRGGKIRVISDNKAHEPEDFGAEEIAIVGRVLWGLKRL